MARARRLRCALVATFVSDLKCRGDAEQTFGALGMQQCRTVCVSPVPYCTMGDLDTAGRTQCMVAAMQQLPERDAEEKENRQLRQPVGEEQQKGAAAAVEVAKATSSTSASLLTQKMQQILQGVDIPSSAVPTSNSVPAAADAPTDEQPVQVALQTLPHNVFVLLAALCFYEQHPDTTRRALECLLQVTAPPSARHDTNGESELPRPPLFYRAEAQRPSILQVLQRVLQRWGDADAHIRRLACGVLFDLSGEPDGLERIVQVPPLVATLQSIALTPPAESNAIGDDAVHAHYYALGAVGNLVTRSDALLTELQPHIPTLAGQVRAYTQYLPSAGRDITTSLPPSATLLLKQLRETLRLTLNMCCVGGVDVSLQFIDANVLESLATLVDSTYNSTWSAPVTTAVQQKVLPVAVRVQRQLRRVSRWSRGKNLRFQIPAAKEEEQAAAKTDDEKGAEAAPETPERRVSMSGLDWAFAGVFAAAVLRILSLRYRL
ncbi:hypothetical protein CDCA_CDCA05G1709 [Cyanidium caldarium]|uniref:Uncharacterized protein n=1 Tax=Cyanidium caldarium TaxID=2771 RepID=A0AAV9IU54_CYACA|nr:hypothetical protein CDCA_CDCA05G1709 [Cyanidium caldarium]